MNCTYKHTLLSLPIITTLMLAMFLASNTVSADDNTSVVDEINITVPISCTISGTGMNTHNANINNGLYEDDIGSTTLHAFCNDNEGFAIYAAGYTGNEVGGTNSNKLVGTNASNNATIESGIATSSGNPDISNWAMKLAITGDSGDTTGTNAFTIDSAPNVSLPSQAEQGATGSPFSQYHVVPNEYTKAAHKNSATDMTESTGGVKFTTTYAAYISKTQAADTYSGQVIYTLVHPAAAPDPGPKSLDTATFMHEVTFCKNTLPEGQVYTLTDSRDNNIYHVARLKDGNCWMLDNLALDPTNSTTAQNMNEANTNATAEAIANLLNGGSSRDGWSSVAVTNLGSGFLPSSSDSEVQPWISNALKDRLVVSYGPASIDGKAKIGVYYNYCAVMMGTYCYDRVPEADINVTQDVCSANWRLPTGGNEGEYAVLLQQYNLTQDAVDSRSLQYNLSTALSGYFSTYGPENYDYSGNWWSSTYDHDTSLGTFYSLEVTSANVDAENTYYYRSNLLPVRCLLNN